MAAPTPTTAMIATLGIVARDLRPASSSAPTQGTCRRSRRTASIALERAVFKVLPGARRHRRVPTPLPDGASSPAAGDAPPARGQVPRRLRRQRQADRHRRRGERPRATPTSCASCSATRRDVPVHRRHRACCRARETPGHRRQDHHRRGSSSPTSRRSTCGSNAGHVGAAPTR
ncbi:MAG: hypothetical protein MZV65_48675 [Chromatiales bacterium]|nr:hypothetical protein [Chromatiales bacterium]